MSSSTYGAIKLATAEEVGTILKKKMGTQTGYKPKDWADTINLLGKLPIRTASGSIAHFTDGADDVPLKSLTAQILPIQSGTGDPSPTNVRPIIGTSVLNVEQRGKNLFNEANATLSNLSLSNHVFTNTHTDTRANFQFQAVLLDDNSQAIQSLFSQSVTATGAFSRTVTITNSGYSKLMIKHNGSTRDLRIIVPFTYPKETVTISTNFLGVDVQTVGGLSFENLQIEVGTTATAYEPYKGTTYTKALGQTVYHGSLNISTGLLTIDRLKNVFGSSDTGWQEYASNNDIIIFRRENAVESIKDQNNQISNLFLFNANAHQLTTNAPNTFVQGASRHLFVQVAKSDFPNLNSFLTFLGQTNLEYIYDVANIEVQLTPQEVRTLLGSNNIYHDANGDSTIEYRADMNLLIASLEGNRGLQMLRATPTEETETEEVEENEDER